MAQTGKENIENEKAFVVAGYTFPSQEAAQEAKDELNAIKYMTGKTNSNDPVQIYALYNKILDKELFKTPVGIDYLKDLQQYLYIHRSVPNEKIRPIPIHQEIQEAIDDKRQYSKYKDQIKQLEKDVNNKKNWLIRSVIFNIMLLIAVLVMIWVAANSSNVNIINYENKLQDRYASWQEELESREAEIIQRERALEKK